MTNDDQKVPVCGLAVAPGSARIVEGDVVVKPAPFSQHGTMRRNDCKGTVIRTRDHPTLGPLLLVKHEGRKTPIWWSANHWKPSSLNIRSLP